MGIRIFVGCAANDDDLESQAVLEYTLTKHASQPVEITWMQQSRDSTSWFYVGPGGGWETSSWATPFSGFRWIIPFMAQAEGRDRAIYMDSDFIVFGDIADLWNTEFQPGKAVAATGNGRYCCSLWNVPQALEYLPAYPSMRTDPTIHSRMSASYAKHPERVQPFASNNQWNWLDHDHVPLDQLQKRGIKAVHYTRIETQLQIKHALKRLAKEGRRHWSGGKSVPHKWPGLQDLFDKLLEEAQCNGFPLERYMVKERFGNFKIRR